MRNQEKYKIAKKRVKAKKEFFEHLSTYLGMATFFFLLNFFTSPGRWWFYWPMFGWGIGVLAHYLSVFGIPGVGQLDENWEKRALEQELEKLNVDLDKTNKEEEKLDLPPLQKEKELKKKWRDEDLV